MIFRLIAYLLFFVNVHSFIENEAVFLTRVVVSLEQHKGFVFSVFQAGLFVDRLELLHSMIVDHYFSHIGKQTWVLRAIFQPEAPDLQFLIGFHKGDHKFRTMFFGIFSQQPEIGSLDDSLHRTHSFYIAIAAGLCIRLPFEADSMVQFAAVYASEWKLILGDYLSLVETDTLWSALQVVATLELFILHAFAHRLLLILIWPFYHVKIKSWLGLI